MKRLFQALVAFLAVSAAMWLTGQRISKRFQGDTTPNDDSFRVMAFMGGAAVESRATALRSVQARVVAGGLYLDLTGATLSPEGAHVDLEVKAGGVQVSVPATWRVYVVHHVDKGEVEVEVPDPDTLPSDAPILTIQAEVKAGGVVVRSKVEAPVPA